MLFLRQAFELNHIKSNRYAFALVERLDKEYATCWVETAAFCGKMLLTMRPAFDSYVLGDVRDSPEAL